MGTAIGFAPREAALTGGRLVAFLTAAHLATDAFTGMFSALLPTVQARYGLSETGLALLVAALAFSASVTQPPMGALADRVGRRPVAALGVALSAALIGLVGVVPTAPLLVGLLLVGGLGSAAFHPAGTSIARAAMGGKPGLAVALFSAGGTLGIALGPVLVLAIVAGSGLQATRWLLLPGLLLGLLTYLVVPPQPRCATPACPKLIDTGLMRGPVGLLALAGILASVAFITFTSAMPLWLVAERGLERDAPLLGWTLSLFSLSAALGGIVAGALAGRLGRRTLVAGGMLLAPLPLLATLRLDLAPRAVGAASGMLMGFSTGTAGLLYVGVGRLQELVGLGPAMGLSYLALVPAAAVAFAVLTRYRTEATGTPPAALPACGCAVAIGAPCPCGAAGMACTCAQSRREQEPGGPAQAA